MATVQGTRSWQRVRDTTFTQPPSVTWWPILLKGGDLTLEHKIGNETGDNESGTDISW